MNFLLHKFFFPFSSSLQKFFWWEPLNLKTQKLKQCRVALLLWRFTKHHPFSSPGSRSFFFFGLKASPPHPCLFCLFRSIFQLEAALATTPSLGWSFSEDSWLYNWEFFPPPSINLFDWNNPKNRENVVDVVSVNKKFVIVSYATVSMT